MTNRMQNKIVLVTGAGSIGKGWGNGKAASVLYAREGAQVIACDINIDAANETVELINKEGGQSEAIYGDVGLSKDVEKIINTVEAKYGRIDVLHSNVGIVEVGGPEQIEEENWDKLIRTNLKSLYLLSKYTLPLMVKNGGGVIVAISSIAGSHYLGYPSASYSASKGALELLVKNIALQYAKKNIRANCVCPGLMDTPQIRAYVTEGYGGDESLMIEQRNNFCPTGSMGTAWDVAHAALFLASDEARYITGQSLVVDGGITSRIA